MKHGNHAVYPIIPGERPSFPNGEANAPRRSTGNGWSTENMMRSLMFVDVGAVMRFPTPQI